MISVRDSTCILNGLYLGVRGTASQGEMAIVHKKGWRHGLDAMVCVWVWKTRIAEDHNVAISNSSL